MNCLFVTELLPGPGPLKTANINFQTLFRLSYAACHAGAAWQKCDLSRDLVASDTADLLRKSFNLVRT